MAVTSLWPVKSQLSHVINYIRNPEKTVTEGLNNLAALHQINGVMEYAADDVKTEKRELVTGINCTEEYAARQFMNTKRHYGQTEGRLCYHGYQSFKSDEINAETVHAIGVELAKRLWGNRFEVLVATHCNTGHYHNHFVLNSVSFMDGKRFRNSHEDYRQMRAESDRLCREYGLSVIEKPKNKSRNYSEWAAEKSGEPTIRSTIRADIDRAVSASVTEQQFKKLMEEMGYEFKTRTVRGERLKYPALRPPGANGFFRFHKLGEEYELDRIIERIYQNDKPKVPFPDIEGHPYKIPKEYRPEKLHGIYALYIKYCFQLHIIKEHPTSMKRVHFLLRDDIIKLDKLDSQVRFMASRKIETLEDLQEAKSIAEQKTDGRKAEQHDLYNELRKARRSGDAEAEKKIRQRLTELSAELKDLRKEVRLCVEIEERSEQAEKNLKLLTEEQENERKEREENELLRRSGGSGREDIPERG